MNIFDLTFEQLTDYLLSIQQKKYRSTQIWEFLYRHRVQSFSEMYTLGAPLIATLEANFTIDYLQPLKTLTDSDGTIKILYQLNDQQKIECVVLNNAYGYSLCVSTQVGCNMGCIFCASGQHKKIRDLQSGEMVSQILSSQKHLNIDIRSVVIMGIGEPFDNYQNVLNFIKIINQPKGLEIGIRHITISTCGIIPKIKQFMQENLQVNLAISLHASDDKTRTYLMKINQAYPFLDLIASIKEYLDFTKRRVTIEYILIDHVNDQEEDAHRLINLFKNLNVYFNLIPYNPVTGVNLHPSTRETRQNFFNILKKAGIDVTIRNPQGENIEAACGQLRIKNL
ncbi:MAG: 23S rRNA (adenine(2503)-C(2))-methyltransferase RlmN [Acholeplasmatales bacterium]|jgi:23S rRNA (adenine2503-C2)-methyltransferase|nr:23S rRNA (adenine(2503)-C(2))-methyltransferase RlmN [Acholeplasmatales bacterium]